MAEMTMGRQFNNWVVHDYHDFHVLKQLCKAKGIYMPVVIISSFDNPLHHIPEHFLIPGSVSGSLLDVVSCTEPGFNAVIMYLMIDQVCLLLTCAHNCTLLSLTFEVWQVYDTAAGNRFS